MIRSANQLLIFLLFLFSLACTNFDLQQLNKRVDENFTNSTLLVPADIDPPGTDNFSFVIMGDTHIGSPGGEVMKRMVADAVTHGDAFAIVAGDLSQGGLPGEFDQFNTVFSVAGLKYRATIGNHDIFFGGWDNFKTKVGRSIYSFNADNVHFVMIDSANGVLGETQLNWLDADLAANSRPHAVIVTHFPPWNGFFSSIYKMSSEEEAAILKDIAYRHHVDLVVAGHFHGYAENDIGGVKYIVTGGANDILDLGQRQNYVRVQVNGSSFVTQVIYF